MSSSIGNTVKLSLFGESHGDAVGAILEGLPAGIEVNEEVVRKAAEIGHDWKNPVWRTSDGVVAEW